MRTIVNISLPPSLKKEVDKAIKEGHYASVSEFFRDALKEWKNAQLIRELKHSQLEAAAGKTKILRSLKDLRK